MKQGKTLFLVEVAIFTALAYLLDVLSGVIIGQLWPQGGSVSIQMVPVFLMAYRWGLKGGLLTGFLLGLLQVILGWSKIYHPVQGFVDYFVAFTVVGVAGIFARQVKQSLNNNNKFAWISYTLVGVLIGCTLRFLAHFYTGIVFFGAYAPEGQPVALYSLVYNSTYMVPSFILCAITVVLVIAAAPNRMVLKS